MKNRVFYILHLDRNRIFFLSFSFIGMLLFSFALGHRFAKIPPAEREGLQKEQDFPLFSLKEIETSKEEAKSETGEAKTEGELVLLENESEPEGGIEEKRNSELAYLPQRPYAPEHSSSPSPKERKAKKKVKRSSAKNLLGTPPKQKRKRVKSIARPKERKGKLRLANLNKNSSLKKIKRAKRSSYTLQLGAFRSQDAAKRMQKELEEQGFTAQVKKKKQMHLVQIGQNLSMKEIKEVESSLRKEKYFPIRVKE